MGLVRLPLTFTITVCIYLSPELGGTRKDSNEITSNLRNRTSIWIALLPSYVYFLRMQAP